MLAAVLVGSFMVSVFYMFVAMAVKWAAGVRKNPG
jgi:hypothetical protein